MTKRQKLIRDSYFKRSHETNSSDFLSSTNDSMRSTESLGTKQVDPSQAELAQTLRKEQWASRFQWLHFFLPRRATSFAKFVGRREAAQCTPKRGQNISR